MNFENLMRALFATFLAAFFIFCYRADRLIGLQEQRTMAATKAMAASPVTVTGPSRVRLLHLLHECRKANREHLRMLKVYDAEATTSATECTKVTGQVVGDEWICTEPLKAPAQKAGSVEFGLGGL